MRGSRLWRGGSLGRPPASVAWSAAIRRTSRWFDNAKWARTSGFRAFVHPPHRIQETIEGAAFVLVRRRFTLVWTMDVYMRADTPD